MVAERRKKARQERDARRPHETNLHFMSEEGSISLSIHTAGWVYVPDESSNSSVTLKRVLGPSIPPSQRIPTLGVEQDREEALRKFLGDALDDPERDTVILQFVDSIPE